VTPIVTKHVLCPCTQSRRRPSPPHLHKSPKITLTSSGAPNPIGGSINALRVLAFAHLRRTICDKLLPTLGEIKSGKVFRGVLWILGEYLEGDAGIKAGIQEIRKVLGEIPILASEQRLLDEAEGDGGEVKNSQPLKVEEGSRLRVLVDGTYATTVFTSPTAAKLEATKAVAKPPLRSKGLEFS
jgi:vesicle coat complex subunit